MPRLARGMRARLVMALAVLLDDFKEGRNTFFFRGLPTFFGPPWLSLFRFCGGRVDGYDTAGVIVSPARLLLPLGWLLASVIGLGSSGSIYWKYSRSTAKTVVIVEMCYDGLLSSLAVYLWVVIARACLPRGFEGLGHSSLR